MLRVCRVSPILFFEQYSCALTINTIVLGDGYQVLRARNMPTAAQAFNAGHNCRVIERQISRCDVKYLTILVK
jgi:hypothetical protein